MYNQPVIVNANTIVQKLGAKIITITEINVVNSSFVATHIAFVEQVHANRFVGRKTA